MKDVNQNYYGYHFSKYTDIKSLCYTPETSSIMDLKFINEKLVTPETQINIKY